MNRTGRARLLKPRAQHYGNWYGGGFWNSYNRSNWEPAFAALDLNVDGVITQDEFFSAATWARLDPNNTGLITAWPWS